MRTLIVGAGAAGAVIAARLSEDARHDVVLLEAGPDYPHATEEADELPPDLRNGLQNSLHRHDWGYDYRATAHRLFSALPMGFPRGRVVGGSSAVNTCIALRGQPFDYDEWASKGLPDWAWSECLPAFKRLETDADFDNEWHGRAGPIPIRRHTPSELVPWQAAFLEAARELGFPSCADTNDPATTGAGPHAMNKVRGERMSAARCYLGRQVRARPNFHLVPDATVHRVLVRNGRALGVVVERFGVVRDVLADRVVLAGGAIATPGILLRSGVGPRDECARLGVPLVSHVPGVGARLLDHPGVAVFFRPKAEGFSRVDHPLIQTVCRVGSSGAECPNDLQIQPGSFVPLPHFPLARVTLSACIGKPHGHGTIRFPSARVSAKPRLDTRFLSDARDRAVAMEALAWIGRFSRTKALSALATPVYPSKTPFDDEGTFVRPLEQVTGSGYHPCGTVPMGPDSDPMAATSGRGHVRGVKALFVADASLMPTIPSSNTHLPTLMIGERFGEWLRDPLA